MKLGPDQRRDLTEVGPNTKVGLKTEVGLKAKVGPETDVEPKTEVGRRTEVMPETKVGRLKGEVSLYSQCQKIRP